MFVAPANFALSFTPFARLYDAAVDLDGLLLVEIVITIFVLGVGPSARIRHPVALLARGCTPVNHAFSLQVTVRRLIVRPEVLHTEFEPAKLDDIALLKPVIVQNRLLIVRLLLALGRFLRFQVSHHHEHHVRRIALRGLGGCLAATVPRRIIVARVVCDYEFA